MRGRHRVALELEIDRDPGEAEPEDWDLQSFMQAVRAGVARPLRTIRGLVVDTEHDRLSSTLDAMAEDIDEAAQLHWLASARQWPALAHALRSRRPSLEVLVELDQLAAAARRVAERLAAEGL
jgi:hypothetical protein